MYLDVFNHFMPKAYLDRLADLIPGHVAVTAFPRLKALWDVKARLASLDEFDDLQQVVSLANPPLELIAPPDRTPVGPPAHAHPQARTGHLVVPLGGRRPRPPRHRRHPHPTHPPLGSALVRWTGET